MTKSKYILSILIFLLIRNTSTATTTADSLASRHAINKLLNNHLSDLPETREFDRRIQNFMKTWKIDGASLAIMKDNRFIYAKGYGWADKEKNIPVDVNHIFRIASVSKLITAIAIMKLKEEGKLRLEDNVFGPKGILNAPEFQNITDYRAKEITVEHLLRHQGGMLARGADPMFNIPMVAASLNQKTVSDKDIIIYALRKPLTFMPGTGTSYSNLGYFILSKIIEKISGSSYENYIKKEILESNGIYDMHLARNLYAEKFPNEVKYYEPEKTTWVKSYDGSGRKLPRCYGGSDIHGLLGAGAWVASPAELLKLVSIVDGDPEIEDILSPESVSYMVTGDSKTLPIGWAKINPQGEWLRSGTLSSTNALIKKQNDGFTWIFITNTGCWRGPGFTTFIDKGIREAIETVTEWPDRNLFNVL